MIRPAPICVAERTARRPTAPSPTTEAENAARPDGAPLHLPPHRRERARLPMGVREAGQARHCVRVGALHLRRPHVHAPCCVGRIGTGFPVRGARGRTRSARQARAGPRGLVPAVRRLLLVLSKPTSSAAGASGARQRAPALTLALRASRLLGYHPLDRCLAPHASAASALARWRAVSPSDREVPSNERRGG